MKRILLVVLVVCLLAGQASAGMYMPDVTETLSWSFISGSETGNVLNPGFPTSDINVYDPVIPQIMGGQVGFVGSLNVDLTPVSGWSWSRLGRTSAGLDLSSYDSYVLPAFNDNDDAWWVRSFITSTGDGTTFSSGGTTIEGSGGWFQLLGVGTRTVLTLNLAGLNKANVTAIGFDVGAYLSGIPVSPGITNPSPSDAHHISVVPVPAAVILGILGLGVVGLKLRKYA